MTVQATLTSPQRARLGAADFWALADAGAFEGYARAELIDGELWVVNAIHRRHARVHAQLTGELFVWSKATGSQLVLYTAPSTELSDDAIPEPDIALAEPDDGRAVDGKSVKLAIEIADTTLENELGRKLRLYARYGVPEYWVADVEANGIHQFWSPAGEEYAERRQIPFGQPITAATIPGLVLDTAGLS